jgi:hypothetical protein
MKKILVIGGNCNKTERKKAQSPIY